ncbi:MAG: hypothetical protein B6A08_06060 [Sorangiineae bacterium NIC37A_2]|jgi:recombinational DNA repair ATPase RecF|nr:MAG: hypothetical protein B6A08_06060 [Sorangiineae bacterium NIC37A_2]
MSGGKTPQTSGTWESWLVELGELLMKERAALQRMDALGVEAASAEKLALLERLEGKERAEATPEALRELARLREVALENQLLLVHARDLLRGAVESLGPSRDGRGALLEAVG